MSTNHKLRFDTLDETEALRLLLERTSTATGTSFFNALVRCLAHVLGTDGAWVTEYEEKPRRLHTRAFFMDGDLIPNYVFEVAGTPCEQVIESRRLVHIPDRLLELYPGEKGLRSAAFVSYMGMPLIDTDDCILGHVAVVDRRPMAHDPRAEAIFRVFSARATAELQRLRRETQLAQREIKLRRLIGSALDAIIELDDRFQITLANAAAEKAFGGPADRLVGQDFHRFLAPDSRDKLVRLVEELAHRPSDESYLWISGGLEARRLDGRAFPAEASLSRFELGPDTFHALILRNIDERREAENRIRSLTVEAEYLKQELNELTHADEIIGVSEPLQRVLRDIRQVAATDATVLICGETGTGKELIARAIHAAGFRRDKPLVRVNCAAVPGSLIESEFFGHEKGAFTGASASREGRFAMADRGTIFLDEVGELPLDLQAKLLRVLQEGEFEPVGSSRTRKVDVRVLAATNRDLQQAVRDGTFRDDLFYRLNVFPIHLPPLRERPDDIPPLAQSFARRFASRLGRTLEPLSDADLKRLSGYPWPGNVRELENVIERAVITSTGGRLNLDRALPPAGASAPHASADPSLSPSDPSALLPADPSAVLTIDQLQDLERANLLRALESTGWKVSGPDGAARLLGMKASTLASRIKTLGLRRPPF